MEPSRGSTFIACLTPPGQCAIATLGMHGPAAWDALRALFRSRSGKPLPDAPCTGQSWLGRCGADVADDVVLAVRDGRFEIHSHGGHAVVQMLLDLFAARGIGVCSWQDSVQQTDSGRAEATIALAHASTARTAAILLDQYHGAFAAAMRDVVAALNRGEVPSAKKIVADLSRWTPLGRHLTEPWRVVVAGAPNVGKSSLVNALAGYQRSVVAPTPGTTRDVVTARLAVDGWPIELADTAGLRAESGAVEAAGIALARKEAARADLCIWVFDATTQPRAPEEHDVSVLRVINKTDLLPGWDLDAMPDAVRVSAITGSGLGDLCAALARRLVPDVPSPGAAVPFTPRLCELVEEMDRKLTAGDFTGARAVCGALSSCVSR
jgi:tRNA modification GTPase